MDSFSISLYFLTFTSNENSAKDDLFNVVSHQPHSFLLYALFYARNTFKQVGTWVTKHWGSCGTFKK